MDGVLKVIDTLGEMLAGMEAMISQLQKQVERLEAEAKERDGEST